MDLEKAPPVSLKTMGLGEKWLQDRISEDPGLLGLGELEIAGREHRLPVGGRMDSRDQAVAELQAAGVDASPRGAEYLTFNINRKVLQQNIDLLTKTLEEAEVRSR